jgi:AcrR family transcriptional regulator
MESQTTARRASARERLLAAADELFYENGINLVGIDRVIEHAGAAKASLYDCFGSKEELIRAYLKGRADKRQARIVERIAGLETPREKILGIFDLLAEIVNAANYRGCLDIEVDRVRLSGAIPRQHAQFRFFQGDA